MGCKQSKNRLSIAVCSNSGEDSVQGLIRHITENMPDVVEPADLMFMPLPYNMADMKEFEFRGIDALLLCHSMDIKGPFCSELGSNSIYHKFLYKAKRCLGKKKVAVIVHDYKLGLSLEALETYSKTNKSTFNMTSLVLTLGQLAAWGGSTQLTDVQLDEFKSFFEGALSCRRIIVGAFYRFFYRLIRQ
ncbi:uncharacterized protein LOC105440498 [Strongylocentrotus purpuratus]|uniref:Uncharacterized protein n=1 Tax=Strongylocentrotus purpuratus TaxID=7668 RepID=A0A7M7PUF5_STRPU|nr:uncharacterized protein LOC105440498 [Strongylocentrotus purpuratus]